MDEETVKELFDTDLVRLWRTDEEGNAVEPPVDIEIPVLEVNVVGDGQDWAIIGCNGVVERGGCR